MAQSQFPESIHAAARALMVIQRESSRNAEQALRTMFPGERIPDDSTLRVWRSTFPEISQEEDALIAQNNRRIALLASDSVIEDLEQRPHDSSAYQKMLISGIAQSKEHERLQRNQGPTTVIPVQIIINNTQ